VRIVVADLPRDGIELSGEVAVDLDPEDSPDGLSAPEPVRYDVAAVRDRGCVRISGHVAVRVVAGCSRCARLFDIDVDHSFKALYKGVGTDAERLPTELDENDLSLDYYEGDAIDGDRLIAEQVLLALPMKLLCDEDCRGLCPSCGVNRNDTDCRCEPEGDPRLASLEAIRDQL